MSTLDYIQHQRIKEKIKMKKKYDPDKIPLPKSFGVQIMMTPANAHYLRCQPGTNSGIVNRLIDDLRKKKFRY